MTALIISLLFSTTARAWDTGNAPFCVMDNYGNTECYYYDLSSCRQAAKLKIGDAACVKK